MAWIPGVTRVKSRQTGGRFVWTKKVDAYPVLTAEDRRRLAFGEDRRNRGRAEQDEPWEHVAGMRIVRDAVDPTTDRKGWRLVPSGVTQPENLTHTT